MKKITALITSLSIISSLVLLPGIVLAEDTGIPSIDVSTADATSDPSTTSTTDTTAGVPETGIAPQQSKLAQNSVVFLVGSSVGAALGVGIVAARKKKSQL